jgi:AraC-like DNA-binding protein
VLDSVLGEQGVGTADLLAGSGIDPDAIRSSATRISRRQLITTYCNAVRLSPTAGLGLIAGKRLHVTEYGMYGYALISSANLKEALELSIRYHELATPTVRMNLDIDDDDTTAIFGMTDVLQLEALIPFNLELQFSLVLSLFKDMVGDDFAFQEIRASYHDPGYRERYAEMFGCQVLFGQARNELRFDEWWLGRELVRSNPITAEHTREICRQILAGMKVQEGLASEVNELLTQDLRAYCDIESLAQRLHMTSRTLRRKLGNQGTSFQELLREVRTQLAIAYLRNTSISLDDIAYRLGFSDAANFRHAFKRWTGNSPGTYRGGRSRAD